MTPCHNSRTNKDNLMNIGHKVDHIDGIADKKSQGAGYTCSRSIGQILNFLIFFMEHIWSLWPKAKLLHIKLNILSQKLDCPKKQNLTRGAKM